MKYLTSFVQRPTTAPTPSDLTAGTFQVAHRRRNLSGAYCQAVIGSGLSLPNTLSYQGYADSGNLSTDEILLKDPASSVWRKVPSSRVSGGTVAITETSVPTTWEAVTVAELADNQADSAISSLDFGAFSAASEPTRAFYLLNDGTDTIQSLTLGIRDIQGALVGILTDRVSLTITGTYPSIGAGNPVTTFNGSLVFSTASANTIPLTLAPSQAARITLQLINFPATGLASTPIEAEIALTPNGSASAAPAFLDWLDGHILYSAQYGLDLVTDDPASTGLLVQPFSVRLGGRIFTQDIQVPFVPDSGTGNYRLLIERSGGTLIQLASVALADSQVVLAEFTWDSSTGALTNYKTVAPVQTNTLYLEANGILTPGHWVAIDSTGHLEESGTNAIGVAASSEGSFVALGITQVVLAEAASVGDRLGPNSSALTIQAAEGPATALQDGGIGDTILVFLSLVGTGGTGGGGSTNLGSSRTATAYDLTSSTGTGTSLAAATTSLAGVMAATDKTKLDGIATGATANSADGVLLARANHTGTQTASTISDFGEAVDDRVAGLLVAGTNVTLAYDDGAGTLTISASGGGGGGGATNLSTTTAASTVTVESDTGTDATIPAATTSLAGVMTATDKTKLNGIATGATANSADGVLVARANHTGTQLANTISDFTEAAQDAVAAALVAGNGIQVVYSDGANTITLVSNCDLSATPASSTVTVSSSTGNNAVIPAATTSLAGVLTATDKTKLNGIATGATANSADGVLLARANHTGTQTASTISDFTEAAQDAIGSMFTGGTITGTYNDGAGTIALNSTMARGGINYVGTVQSMAGSAWNNYPGSGTLSANSSGVSVVSTSGGTNNALQVSQAGWYLVNTYTYFSHLNSTSVRLLVGINGGAGGTTTFKNTASSATLDGHFSYVGLMYFAANATITPAAYVDSVSAGPVNQQLLFLTATRVA